MEDTVAVLRGAKWKQSEGISFSRWFHIRYVWWLPYRAEIHYSLLDLGAVVRGYCNHKPNDGTPESGGYPHWRCGLKRRHSGLHRALNYVWTDDGRTEFQPVPNDHVFDAKVPGYRKILGPTFRQRLARKRWHIREEAARRRVRG